MSSTENVRKYEDLPVNAQKYVELIEDKLGLPGIIHLKNPYDLLLIIFSVSVMKSLFQWDGSAWVKIGARWFRFIEQKRRTTWMAYRGDLIVFSFCLLALM